MSEFSDYAVDRKMKKRAESRFRQFMTNIGLGLRQFKYLMYFFAPEVILLVTAVIYFARNSLISSPLYILVFALFLVIGMAVKAVALCCGTGFTGDSLTLGVLAFFTAMCETGIFFQLYIRGLTPNEIKKLVMLTVTAALFCAVLIVKDTDWFRNWFVGRRLVKKHIRNSIRQPDWYWFGMGVKLLGVTALLLLLAALVLRRSFSLQIKAIEAAKFTMVLSLAAFGTVSEKKKRGAGTLISTNAELIVGIISIGLLALSQEFGTLIILLLFLEMSLLLSRKWLWAGALLIVCMTGYEVVYFLMPEDSHVYQRLFDLTAFEQVNQVRDELTGRTYIWPNPARYEVNIGGELATRCEDFSFLNLLTVFGKLAAVMVLGAYLLLTLVSAFAIKRSASSGKPDFIANAGVYSALMLFGSCSVHALANTTAYFFTGVGMPFVSDGITNLVFSCVYLCLIALSLSSRKEEADEAEKESELVYS